MAADEDLALVDGVDSRAWDRLGAMVGCGGVFVLVYERRGIVLEMLDATMRIRIVAAARKSFGADAGVRAECRREVRGSFSFGVDIN